MFVIKQLSHTSVCRARSPTFVKIKKSNKTSIIKKNKVDLEEQKSNAAGTKNNHHFVLQKKVAFKDGFTEFFKKFYWPQKYSTLQPGQSSI